MGNPSPSPTPTCVSVPPKPHLSVCPCSTIVAMPDRVRVGLLGCGHVGSAVARMLLDHAGEVSLRAGADVEIARVAVRNLSKERDVELAPDRKSARLNSSHRCISYAVFCLK